VTSELEHDSGPQALRDALRRDLTSAMKARQPDAGRRLHDQARLLTGYLR
jgi:hypothetical protein